MEVILAKSAGFCYGVERAVKLAKQTAAQQGSCVMLGSIIHNANVVAELEQLGARTVEDVLVARALQLQAADCEENPTERQEIIRRVHEAYASPEALLPKQGKYLPR